MVRTQIYLTEEERGSLSALAKATGKKQAELIREAVDQFVELASGNRREAVVNHAAGIWRERKDLPDFAKIRQSLDRS